MNSGPNLAINSTGADVRRLQILLVMMKLLDFLKINSTFGPETLAAVKSFQQGKGLADDGIVGPLTWNALPADPKTPLLGLGASGGIVSSLQKGLVKYGGAGSLTDPGAIDGDFGPKTKGAVKAYQSRRGTTSDGIVGDRTWWVPAGGAGATLASLSALTTI